MSGRAARVPDEDVDAAERLQRALDHGAERARVGDVAAHGERPDAIGLALQHLSPAREHRHVRAFPGERLGRREPKPGRRSADDRGAALEPEVHRYVFKTPTTSRTASADSFSIVCSSSVSSSSTISSTPPAPSLTGTPMYSRSMPYSPSR